MKVLYQNIRIMPRNKSGHKGGLTSLLYRAVKPAQIATEALAAETRAKALAAEIHAEALAATNRRIRRVVAFFNADVTLKAALIAACACNRASPHLTVLREKINSAPQRGYWYLTSEKATAYDFEKRSTQFLLSAENRFSTAKLAVHRAQINPLEYVKCPDFANLHTLLNEADVAEDAAKKAHGYEYDADEDGDVAGADAAYAAALEADAAALPVYAAIAEMTDYADVCHFTGSVAVTQSLQLFRLARCAEEMARASETHDKDALKKAATTAKKAIRMADFAAGLAELPDRESAKEAHIAAEAAAKDAAEASLCAKLRPIHGELFLIRIRSINSCK